MPTKKYKVNGRRVPGATTVISTSLGWGKEGLLHWAWKQGQDGKDFREERDKAADAGTIAHAMAEADVKGLPQPVPPAGMDDTEAAAWIKGQNAFEAYLTWKRMTQIRILLSEVSFISEELLFGGTLDGVGIIDDKLCLIDFKTSNSTYPDHLIQMAAYRHLWERGQPFENPVLMNRTPFEGIHILRFSKAGGDFHHSYYRHSRMDKPWTAFQMLRQLYDLKKEIEEMV